MCMGEPLSMLQKANFELRQSIHLPKTDWRFAVFAWGEAKKQSLLPSYSSSILTLVQTKGAVSVTAGFPTLRKCSEQWRLVCYHEHRCKIKWTLLFFSKATVTFAINL